MQLGCSLVKQHLKARELVLGEVEMFILMDAIMNAYESGLGFDRGLCASMVLKESSHCSSPGRLACRVLHNLSAHTEMAARTWR